MDKLTRLGDRSKSKIWVRPQNPNSPRITNNFCSHSKVVAQFFYGNVNILAANPSLNKDKNKGFINTNEFPAHSNKKVACTTSTVPWQNH